MKNVLKTYPDKITQDNSQQRHTETSDKRTDASQCD